MGLKTLKNRLSEYVRLAANGETVLVTDRDHVVAELTPPKSDRSVVVGDALLAEAVRKGWVRPPTLATSVIPPRLPVTKFKTLMKEIEKDRSDR